MEEELFEGTTGDKGNEVQPETTIPTEEAKAPEKQTLDDLASAAFDNQDDRASERTKSEPKSSAEDDSGPEVEQPEKSEPEKIAITKGKIVVDEEGNEYRAEDLIWRTQSYHRRLQEVDADLKVYKQIDKLYKTDPVSLVKSILREKEPKLAEAFEYVINKAAENKVYDPAAAKMREIEFEKAELERQRNEWQSTQSIEQARSQVVEDVKGLESSLGRNLTNTERSYMAKVLQAWEAKRAVEPNTPLPAITEVYNYAVRMAEFDTVTSKNKSIPTTERPAPSKKASAKPTLDDLYEKMEASLRM